MATEALQICFPRQLLAAPACPSSSIAIGALRVNDVCASVNPLKPLHARNQRKQSSLGSSRIQPVKRPQALNSSSSSSSGDSSSLVAANKSTLSDSSKRSLPSLAGKPFANAPWFGKPTRPGPKLEDGADYHDFFGLNKLSHTSGSLAAGAMFLALGLCYFYDLRWQMVAYCLAFVPAIALECWQHHSMDSMHRVHARLMPGNMAIIGAFVALGGFQAMLAGPRDVLFYMGFCFLLPFSAYSTVAAYVMSMWKRSPTPAAAS